MPYPLICLNFSPHFFSLVVDTSSTGPAHGMLSRLQLGLAVRKAGALYPQAIQLAISHLILEILALESNSSSSSSSSSCSSSGSSSSMKTDESTNDVMGGTETPSVFYGIFDALVGACGVPKMADAITNYKQHTLVHSEALSNPLVDEMSPRLISKLKSSDVIDVLIACNDVLEALTVLDLTESYKITPLLSGDLMKQVLKNIPKGTMFGEVCCCPCILIHLLICLFIYLFVCLSVCLPAL